MKGAKVVQRWDMSCDCDGDSGRCRNDMIVDAEGDYVLYADYVAALEHNCTFPVCKSDAYQDALADDVVKQIYGDKTNDTHLKITDKEIVDEWEFQTGTKLPQQPAELWMSAKGFISIVRSLLDKQ